MTRTRLLTAAFVCCAASSLLSASARAQTVIDWTGGASSDVYNFALNWSPFNVPNTVSETARFNLAGSFDVTLGSGTTTTVSDLIVNAGDINFASNGAVFATYNTADDVLVTGGQFTLSESGGSGDVRLNVGDDLSVHNTSLFTIDSTTATVAGNLLIGDQSTSFGELVVQNGATLDVGTAFDDLLLIGLNNNTGLGTSRLSVTGAGSELTTAEAMNIEVGVNGPGVLEVLDGATATLANTVLDVGESTFGSRVTVDNGSTLSLDKPGTFETGITRVFGDDIEVLNGSTFNAGGFNAEQSSDILIDGAGSLLKVNNFDLEDTTFMTVSGGATLRLDTFSGDQVDGRAELTITGTGTTVTGSAELIITGDTPSSPASVHILDGARWEHDPLLGTVLGLSVAGFTDSVGELVIDGAGTFVDVGDGTLDAGTGSSSTATMRVSGGAAVEASNLRIAAGDASQANVVIDGASVEAEFSTNIGAFASDLDRGTASVQLLPGSLLNLQGSVSIGNNATIHLNGGELRFGSPDDITVGSGAMNWNNGTVRFVTDTTLSPQLASFLLPTGELGFGQTLHISSTLTLQSTMTLAGGTLSVEGLTNKHLLDFQSGRLEWELGTFDVSPSGPLGNFVDLPSGATIAVADDFFIFGTLTGEGRIEGSTDIIAGGEVRAEAGHRLTFSSAVSNSGEIQLQGGRLDIGTQLNNAATGDIVGRGTLDVGGTGLNNQGDIALSNGQTDIFGDVTNQTTGRVIVSGNADVTFWDDVSHTGALFNVSTGSSATFFGSAGFGITGGGDVFFEADVTPGNSPGLETFGGNVHFGVLSTLEIEIGGTTPGLEYDRVEVDGVAQIDGTLRVELIDLGSGVYQPQLGDSFAFLASNGGAGGMWHTLDLPELAPGLEWMLNPGGVTISLNVVAALEGDYNFDGIVDATDYAVWRESLGQTGAGLPADGDLSGTVDTADYNLWRANFGAVAAASASASVPEPATFLLFSLAIAMPCCAARRFVGTAL